MNDTIKGMLPDDKARSIPARKPNKPAAKWTFMIYMAAHNSLSPEVTRDLQEMRAVGSSPDVHVVVQIDAGAKVNTQRFRVERGGQHEIIQEQAPIDCGSPQALYDFIVWVVDTYPAQHYALVLWSHGSGWEPYEIDTHAQVVQARGYERAAMDERSVHTLRRYLFGNTLGTVLSEEPAQRAICIDDGTGHALDTIELGKVLALVSAKLQRPLDLLGMDACLMSNLEVAYQAQHYVRYIVGSELPEPGSGWPYNGVLSQIVTHPNVPPEDLATHIVNSYTQFYIAHPDGAGVTQSALDLSQVGVLAKRVDALAEALIAHMPKASYELWNAERLGQPFNNYTLWDLKSLCTDIARCTEDPAVRQAAQQVMATLQVGKGHFLLAGSHAGPGTDQLIGLSIYMRLAPMTVSPYYGDLDYAKHHRWSAMLQAVNSPVPAAQEAVAGVGVR